MRARLLSTLSAALVLSACGRPVDPSTCDAVVDLTPKAVTVGGVAFVREVLDATLCGPAYAAPADLDGDGRLDLVVSALGPKPEGRVPSGSVQAYLARGDGFERRELLGPADALRFPNRPTPADLDGDGDVDLVVPLGFFPCSFELFGTPCGGLLQLVNRGDGTFERRDLVEPGDRRFFHGVAVADLDADGARDLVTVSETRDSPFVEGSSALAVLRGEQAAPGTFGPLEELGAGLGTFPSVGDVDGDGDLDVAGAEFIGEKRASYAWMENRGDGRAFERHVISAAHGPGFGLELVPGLLGDGRLVAVGTNHTNPVRRSTDAPSEVSLFVPGADPRQAWAPTTLLGGFRPENRSGQFSPGLFGVGDADGDGRRDVLVSGDGDARVFLLLQRANGAFEPATLEEDLPQAGGMLVTDLDGDGRAELVVTGYEDHVVFVYRRAP